MELAEFVLLGFGPSGKGDYGGTPSSVIRVSDRLCAVNFPLLVFNSLVGGAGWIELKAVIPEEAIFKKGKSNTEQNKGI